MSDSRLVEFKELVRSRTDIVQLIGETVELHQSGRTFKGLCPFHDDHNPSFTVNEESQRYKCWACSEGGDCLDFVKRLHGLSFRDALVLLANRALLELPPELAGVRVTVKATEKRAAIEPQPVKPPKAFPTAEAAINAISYWMTVDGFTRGPVWPYQDISGRDVAFELRFNGTCGHKEFRLVSLHGDRWLIKGPPPLRPLYGLTLLADANVVFVCEGAKAVDAARTRGVVATTSMCGSKSPQFSDWSPLAGKRVIKLPDNDLAGIVYIGRVTRFLSALEPQPLQSELYLPGLPLGGDIADWGGTREELLKLCGL